MVYHLFARDLSAAEVKALCLIKWNHLKVLATLPRHRFLIKRGKEQVVLRVRQIQQATSVLDFLDSFAPMPVRISRIGKYRALPADFEKVPFEHRTDGTDAFDTLYIGCEKFPQHDVYPIALGGVL